MAFCGRREATDVLCVTNGAIVVLSACMGKDTLNCETAVPTSNPTEDRETFVNADEAAAILVKSTVTTSALTAGAVVFTLDA